MKKLLFLILLSTLSLVASNIEVEKKIYKTILESLFPSKSTVKVWSDSQEKHTLFSNIQGVKVVDLRDDADVLMLYKTTDIKGVKDQMIFANGYLIFQRVKGSAVGGFYWQKGRPNLIFVKKKLDEENIDLPKNLKKYIEDIH